MNEKTQKKRDGPIPYRPPVKLRPKLMEQVKRSGLTMNAFLTQAWLDKPAPRKARVSSLGEKLAGKILGMMGQMRDELSALRQALTESSIDNLTVQKVHDLLDSINKRLLEIRWALFKLLGRKP